MAEARDPSADGTAPDGPPFDGVVYQVYPRSFRDTDGDGVGDLAGMRAGLDHLASLGVGAVWSSPFFRSPMADFGYDISDHRDVDPLFGALADVDGLIADAHARGLRVWLDWVANHTSDRHPWFTASRSSREDPHRDWYVWRDPAPDGGPPNNWIRHFAPEPAWTYDDATGQYYLHHFLPEQPDVNWDDPGLREAQLDVLRFWIDRGVDGFRADAIVLIGQDRTYPDDPPGTPPDGRGWFHWHPSTRGHLAAARRVLDERGAVMIGEAFLEDVDAVLAHVGDDALHLAFTFQLLLAPWDATEWARRIAEVDAAFAARGLWPAWVLSNHDKPRLATRVGSRARARAALCVLLTLRGVPTLYQGDELALEDAEVPTEREVDPGGRDGCRAPMPWTSEPGCGWPDPAWLPLPPDAAALSVAAQEADPASALHLTRRLIALRSSHEVLVRGAQRVLGAADGIPDGVLGFVRELGDARMVTLAEMAGRTATVPAFADGAWVVRIGSDGAAAGEGGTFDGTLPADTAVVLERA